MGSRDAIRPGSPFDGKGRYLDNIFIERLWRGLKYEEVYLKAYTSAADARANIGAWLAFYNSARLHRALGYKTPRNNNKKKKIQFREGNR